MSVVAKGWAARTPAISRMVVPELPQSSGADGGSSPPRPRPSIVTASLLDADRREATRPGPPRQASVDWQSPPGA